MRRKRNKQKLDLSQEKLEDVENDKKSFKKIKAPFTTLASTGGELDIINENIVIRQGQTRFYYLMNLFPFSVSTEQSIDDYINNVARTIRQLYEYFPTSFISITRFGETLVKEKQIDKIIDTVKIWSKHYKDVPEEFKDTIHDTYNSYCIFCFTLGSSENIGSGSLELKDVISDLISTGKRFLGMRTGEAEKEKIVETEKRVFNLLSNICIKPSRELTCSIVMSDIYPCYDLTTFDFEKDGAVEETLMLVDNQIESKMGYFTMSNDGVELFNTNAVKTYGCVLEITNLPSFVSSDAFDLTALPNLKIFIRTENKEEMRRRLMRLNAKAVSEALDIMETQEDNAYAVSDESPYSISGEVQVAIKKLYSGIPPVMASMFICVLNTESPQALAKQKSKVLQYLQERKINAKICKNQAKSYVDVYLRNYCGNPLFTDLEFVLATQISGGASVGDKQDKYASIQIGEIIA